MLQDWEYIVPVRVQGEDNIAYVEIYDRELQGNVLTAKFSFSADDPSDSPEIELIRGPGAPVNMTDAQLEEYAREGLD